MRPQSLVVVGLGSIEADGVVTKAAIAEKESHQVRRQERPGVSGGEVDRCDDGDPVVQAVWFADHTQAAANLGERLDRSCTRGPPALDARGCLPQVLVAAF